MIKMALQFILTPIEIQIEIPFFVLYILLLFVFVGSINTIHYIISLMGDKFN